MCIRPAPVDGNSSSKLPRAPYRLCTSECVPAAPPAILAGGDQANAPVLSRHRKYRSAPTRTTFSSGPGEARLLWTIDTASIRPSACAVWKGASHGKPGWSKFSQRWVSPEKDDGTTSSKLPREPSPRAWTITGLPAAPRPQPTCAGEYRHHA
ncbi:hypothetical protein I6A84_42495 [Frankia sp. CNm7]|uniref:Uncharacterized protein n=1 Tax=Frankia nepalensis TaxID=1836974 RepID=A0A937RL63_9ACTN|nr:hypothetical protein [Frankia nepalensis]MBL7498501.1 hypothetical protein [Frankia nepalensis]MBL7509645.1 hypothetical protein [Frankia nepalensis]MBL7524535.1 hypothetical protein [Frankia nepalensis]MBL7630859.1 hypothetical protein [Frankia nepalensis]